MSNTNIYVRRIVFDIEDELTQMYVALDAFPDAPIGVQGWHHKTFPASKSCIEIMQEIAAGTEESWILWPQKVPGEAPNVHSERSI